MIKQVEIDQCRRHIRRTSPRTGTDAGVGAHTDIEDIDETIEPRPDLASGVHQLRTEPRKCRLRARREGGRHGAVSTVGHHVGLGWREPIVGQRPHRALNKADCLVAEQRGAITEDRHRSNSQRHNRSVGRVEYAAQRCCGATPFVDARRQRHKQTAPSGTGWFSKIEVAPCITQYAA